MRKSILFALMAAVSMTPAIASAADRDNWRGRGGDQNANSGQRGDRGGWRGNNGGNGGWRGNGGNGVRVFHRAIA